ncbi:MAG: fused MFS/spermidine synthase [Lachnospiraceae bacterium]|nr:fused MFS/spermidine synthase [Lachnospiraceae bacterium]
MAVELGASRLLAPYFSSSQIVWTIIIGTIMIAMALGNLYGGRKADLDPNPDKLYGRIIIAAIWIAAILVLGNGSGTFATQCRRYYDDVDITGVEIDEKITELASEYFEFPEEVPVITYDGRAYLNAIEDTYDVIMVDAYQDITIPFQMSSREFFQLVEDHLNPGGVMVVNLNMRSDKAGNINAYLADTIGSVFPYIETAEGLTVYEAGDLLLTDDKAPVELLGMQVIDDLIADEVYYYKSVYEQQGLDGLLQQLNF